MRLLFAHEVDVAHRLTRVTRIPEDTQARLPFSEHV